MNKKSVFNIAAVTIIITLVSKLFGAARDLVLSYYYGSTYISDAYLLATTLPVTIFGFIYEGIGSSFIPICSRIENQDERNRFTCNTINSLLLVTLIVVLVIELFPTAVIKLFASGFNSETLSSTIYILRISILGVIFSAISVVVVHYLQFDNKFYSAAARALPMDIVVIISIILSSKYGSLMILAIGIPLSLLVSFVFLVPQTKKTGFKYAFVLDLKDVNVKRLFSWSIPTIISSALLDINSIIDRQFASSIMIGGVSIITYSNRIGSILNSLVFLPIISIMFPSFSKDISSGKIRETASNAYYLFKTMIFLSVPLTLGTLVLSKEIVSVLFERGAFDAYASLLTSDCLMYGSLCIFAYSISIVTTRLFYSSTEMWTPMIITGIGVVINIVGNILLTPILGLKGLSFASAFSATVVSLIQFLIIGKRYKYSLTGFLTYFVKILMSSLLMVVIIIKLKTMIFVASRSILVLFCCFIIGVFVYFVSCFVLRIEEVKIIFRMIKSFINKNIKKI